MHVVAASAVAVVVVDDAQLMGHLSALWGKIGFKKPHVNISWVSLTGKLPPGVNGPALANPFPSVTILLRPWTFSVTSTGGGSIFLLDIALMSLQWL